MNRPKRFTTSPLAARIRYVLNLIVALSILLAPAFPAAASGQTAPSLSPEASARSSTAASPGAATGLTRAPYRPGAAAPAGQPARTAAVALGNSLLPAWLAPREMPASTALLPAWLATGETPGRAASEDGTTGANEGGPALLPAWYAGNAAAGRFGLDAAGQCTPAASLAMQLTIPPYVVSRGNVSGDVYAVTVTNNGAVSTTEVSLLITPNAGFYYLGSSVSVSSTVSYSDTGTGTPGGPSTITVSGDAAQKGVTARRDDDLHLPTGDQRRRDVGAVAGRRIAERRPVTDEL